ncbi:Trypsin- protease [Metarhizium guizhouense ARSEF 977]|uniref:Trypsin-protease n=1 Tax=Metarhizium guizhouense (strain ARSEF 977) TaxID=1276136 RepID=A0A0B4HQC4_METGA|nr:Trypsin- protease [Metarhizium guizhouense ARSEF 977]
MVPNIAIALAAISVVSSAATTIDKRVIGGEDAKDGEFPFIVSLSGRGGQCSGSLLDSTTVLTAAHCLEGQFTSNRRMGGVIADIASAKEHPSYIKGHGIHDIAILKLSTPIERNETIGIDYAVLPANGSDPAPNSNAITAGWGVQGNGDPDRNQAVDKLAKVVIPVRARQDCRWRFNPPEAHPDTICAGANGKDACLGDSGGPLIDQATGQLIGLVSRGKCTNPPTVYTRVGSYIPWIKDHLGGVGSGPNPISPTSSVLPEGTPTTGQKRPWIEPINYGIVSGCGFTENREEKCGTEIYCGLFDWSALHDGAFKNSKECFDAHVPKPEEARASFPRTTGHHQ